MMSWDVSLAPGAALNHVTLIPSSVKRKSISCPRHLGGIVGKLNALSALWWCNYRGQVLCAVQVISACLERSYTISEGVFMSSSLGTVPELELELPPWWRNLTVNWLGYPVWVMVASKMSLGDFWLQSQDKHKEWLWTRFSRVYNLILIFIVKKKKKRHNEAKKKAF